MVESIPTSPPQAPVRPGEGSSFFDSFKLWDEDGFSFGDLLDVINPLQHIPVVSTLYREWTGDDIGHAARVAGGALFGGIIGLAAAAANVLLKETSGNDLGEHVVALFQPDEEGIESGPVFASADPPEGAVEISGLPWLAASPAPDTALANNALAAKKVAARHLPTVPPGALDARFIAAAAPALTAQAAALDGTAPRLPGQVRSGPWVADAMQSALDKYQALMLSRSQQDHAADVSL